MVERLRGADDVCDSSMASKFWEGVEAPANCLGRLHHDGLVQRVVRSWEEVRSKTAMHVAKYHVQEAGRTLGLAQHEMHALTMCAFVIMG